MARISTSRSLHDLGLAVWFGGSLMGAIGLHGAAATLDDPKQRGRATNAGWVKWAPVNAVAIGVHLVGGALVVRENRGRIVGQQGVAGWTGIKTALTAAALGATAATGWYGKDVWREGDVPLKTATQPTDETRPTPAAALEKLRVLQWVVPALTGAIVVANATMGEQQRPAEIAKGTLQRAGTAAAQAVRHPQAAAKSGAAALSS